jgi:hypothetical protein
MMSSESAMKPYQELAAAVILQAIRDFQSRRDDPGEEKTAREEAREFLLGQGDFSGQRHIWCHWLGIHPESLHNFVTTCEDNGVPRAGVREIQDEILAAGRMN